MALSQIGEWGAYQGTLDAMGKVEYWTKVEDVKTYCWVTVQKTLLPWQIWKSKVPWSIVEFSHNQHNSIIKCWRIWFILQMLRQGCLDDGSPDESACLGRCKDLNLILGTYGKGEKQLLIFVLSPPPHEHWHSWWYVVGKEKGHVLQESGLRVNGGRKWIRHGKWALQRGWRE